MNYAVSSNASLGMEYSVPSEPYSRSEPCLRKAVLECLGSHIVPFRKRKQAEISFLDFTVRLLLTHFFSKLLRTIAHEYDQFFTMAPHPLASCA